MVSPGDRHTSDIIQIEQVVVHGFLVTNFEVPSAPGALVLTQPMKQASCPALNLEVNFLSHIRF